VSTASWLGGLRWPGVESVELLVIPVGSTEQHGPHLPLATDTLIATAVAERVVDALAAEGAAVLLGSAVPYGASGEHADFPGTVSAGTEALRLLLVELVRSASAWAERIVFVNGHGGNAAALDAAVEQLRHEGRAVRWVPCAIPGGDAHAGRTETSLLLHLRPGLVAPGAAEAGATAPIERLLPRLRAEGVRAVAPNGVLGDPAGASAEEGAAILERMVGAALDGIRAAPR